MREGESLAAVHARLTSAQRNMVDRLSRAQEAVADAETTLTAKQAAMHALVFDALAKGIPARALARQLAVSTNRIYQIRDQVYRHRTE